MRLVFSTLMALLVLVTVAHAEDRDKARRAFADGRQHFDLGEYKDALESFKLAYRNFEDPKILFNIAQCERQLGNKQDAVDFYRKYLNKIPNAPNRDEVQATIEKLNAALSAERASKAVPPQGTLGEPPPTVPGESRPAPPPPTAQPAEPAPVATAAVTTTPPEKKPLVKKWWLWAAVGGAVVAVGLGVGLGVGLSHSNNQPGTSFPGVAF